MATTLAEMRMFGGNFAPRGWALCDGQLLPISSNQALFSLLGTTYGGDGRTTFALPDMRGRIAFSEGTGPGLRTHRLGSRAGTETNTMTTLTMPAHNHIAQFAAQPRLPINTASDSDDPSDAYLGGASADIYSDTQDTNMGAPVDTLTVTLGNTGNQQPINNIQPFGCVNFIIALQGVFPSRS